MGREKLNLLFGDLDVVVTYQARALPRHFGV
jgi:hypothetical protein